MICFMEEVCSSVPHTLMYIYTRFQKCHSYVCASKIYKAERRSRHEEAAAAAQEHGKDQSLIAELTRTVDSMRRGLSHTQAQLEAWENADPNATVSEQLKALVKQAQDEAEDCAKRAAEAEERANEAIQNARDVPTVKTVMLMSVVAWPVIVTILLFLAHLIYANANPGTSYGPFAAYAKQAAEKMAAAAAAAEQEHLSSLFDNFDANAQDIGDALDEMASEL
jgi:phage shock protein A